MKKLVCALLLLPLFACLDDVSEEKLLTFEAETVSSWLRNNSDNFSEFYLLVERAGLVDLMSAYGTYTCFAPTNDAMRRFYEKSGLTADQLSDEKLLEIVYNHFLTQKVKSIAFPAGALPYHNLDDRYLYFSFGNSGGALEIFINSRVKILQIDQETHNGVIHTIDGVIEPETTYMPEMIASMPRFSLFAEALNLTGLCDSMMLYNDDSYVQRPDEVDFLERPVYYPPFKHYGYTAFVESDSLFAEHGIYDIEDLKRYAAEVYDKKYPEARNRTDPTDRLNSLNRFVAYHLLDRMEAENEFIGESKMHFFTPGAIVEEYIEPMCPNSLIAVQTGTLFNRKKDGSAIRIVTPNMQALNGLIHEIDGIMVYDDSVENDVLNKRLRIDVTSMFPEITTNKLRYGGLPYGDFIRYATPKGYVRDITFSEGDRQEPHWCVDNVWHNYMGNELQFESKYDFTLRLPPIPAGTYEIRISFIPYYTRGVTQMYLDGKPCGIPLDMRLYADNPKIGWIADDKTDDNGVENDKMLHNRGYMKGSDTHLHANGVNIARFSNSYLRMVIATRTFEKTEPHIFRGKCVMDGTIYNFHLNYFEFMPIHLLQTEDRH
jgi:uncharacterized surface protein with fasciclin (FAS1) repeats